MKAAAGAAARHGSGSAFIDALDAELGRVRRFVTARSEELWGRLLAIVQVCVHSRTLLAVAQVCNTFSGLLSPANRDKHYFNLGVAACSEKLWGSLLAGLAGLQCCCIVSWLGAPSSMRVAQWPWPVCNAINCITPAPPAFYLLSVYHLAFRALQVTLRSGAAFFECRWMCCM